MRLLMVTPYVGLVYGGISKIVIDLLQSIGKLGIQVDLVTTNANDQTVLDVPCYTWLEKDGYRIKYFPCWNSNDMILSYSLGRWLTRNLKYYDLVHTHTLFAPMISWTHFLCQIHRVPYIITPHGMLEPWALGNKAMKKKAYFSLLEKNAVSQANAIQATAKPELEQINQLGFASTVLVPNGLHANNYQSLPSKEVFFKQFQSLRDKQLILFLGRIDPKKGLDLLAPAFRQVRERFPNTHLVVAGPDSIDYLPQVKTYFANENCLDQVTFTGMLIGDIKLSALAAATLYVAPSYSEGFSMSVLEGMASALPCVITKGCNFPEAESSQVVCVVESNSDAIAQAMINFLADPEHAVNIGARARDFIFDNYTWDSAANKLKKAYREIAVNNSRLEKAS